MNSPTDLFVVAVLAVIVKKDTFLTLKRSDKKKVAPGVWEVVSGRLEHDEDPFEGLLREIKEETQLKVKLNPSPFDVYTTHYGDKPMVALVYQAQYIEGEPCISEEHDEYKWVDYNTFARISTLKKLVHSIGKIYN